MIYDDAIFPELDVIRKELEQFEHKDYGNMVGEIRDWELWRWNAAKILLKAFYDEPGSPLDITERFMGIWNYYSTLDKSTSLMWSTMKDYAEWLYDTMLMERG